MCPVVRNRSSSEEHPLPIKPTEPISEEKLSAVAPFPLRNLAAEDLRMAMLDFVQVSRALSGLPGQSPSTEDHGGLTLICTEDGQRLVGICEGPGRAGRCPSAAEGRLPCTGSWLMTSGGWTFKVADDAIACPLAVLGLASPPAWSQYAASA
jgi:hypothetical protein